MNKNPYNYTRPVIDTNMFFGRWDLVNKIVSGLTEGNSCSYALYGGRRSGKTSLMRMIESKLNDRLDANIQPIAVPLYIDLQFDPPTSPANFFERLLSRLLEWESSVLGDSITFPTINATSPAPSFAEAFKELYKQIWPKLGDMRMVILVDEAENLNRPTWAHELEENLRALISNVPGVSGHIGLVLAGGVEFYSDLAISTGGSPLRNVLDEEIALPPCSSEEMLRLVKAPTNSEISDDVAYEVVRQSGGQLFLGQFLMQHLWNEGVSKITVSSVNELAIRFPKMRRDYEGWLDAIGGAGEKIYSLLARQEKNFSSKEIQDSLELTVREVKKGLDILTFHNIIDSNMHKYYYRGEMLKNWFIDSEIAISKQPIEIFISYSHKDESLCDALRVHLSTLERQRIIRTWHDRKILPGEEWSGKIDEHINFAQIILFLISADFVASNYCYEIEVKRAMERHEAKDACVIPVILRPTDFEGTPFGKLQALPKNAQPIVEWENQDRALLDVVRGIRSAIEKIRNQS